VEGLEGQEINRGEIINKPMENEQVATFHVNSSCLPLYYAFIHHQSSFSLMYGNCIFIFTLYNRIKLFAFVKGMRLWNDDIY
jgi:hypothetical protein